MRRRIGNDVRAVAVCCWVAAVVGYWWQRVPPAPAQVIPLVGRSVRWTPPMGKVVVLCGRKTETLRPTGVGGRNMQATAGPLEFYDPASGSVTRRCFTDDDEILAVVLAPREVAIVLRSERVEAVSLGDGKTLCPLEGVDPDSRFVFAEGGRIVICHRGRTATAFDLERGERLWSRNFVTQVLDLFNAGCEIISVGVSDGRSPQTWNARRGEPDWRFPGARGPVAISGDGNRFVMFEPGECRVFDSRLQKDVCRVPSIRQGRQADFVSLDDTGRRMCLWYRGRDAIQFQVWDCDTGAEVDVPPGRESGICRLSPDMRWLMQAERIPTFAEQFVDMLPAGWAQRLQKSKLFWDVMVRANKSSGEWISLSDASSGAPLGRFEVPNFAEWLMVLDPERGVAAFGGAESVSCYSVPAVRNWKWLAIWGAVPVLVWIGVWWLRRMVRGRRATGRSGRIVGS